MGGNSSPRWYAALAVLAFSEGCASIAGRPLDGEIAPVGRFSTFTEAIGLHDTFAAGGRIQFELGSPAHRIETEFTTGTAAPKPNAQVAGPIVIKKIQHNETDVRYVWTPHSTGNFQLVLAPGIAYHAFSRLHVSPDDAVGATGSLGLRGRLRKHWYWRGTVGLEQLGAVTGKPHWDAHAFSVRLDVSRDFTFYFR